MENAPEGALSMEKVEEEKLSTPEKFLDFDLGQTVCDPYAP